MHQATRPFALVSGLFLLCGPALRADLPVPGYKQQAVVQWLGSAYPPPALLEAVKTARQRGVSGKEIVVAFDFDGTLSGWNTSFDKSKPVHPVTNPQGMLRGGKAMRDTLAALKDAGVQMVIDTAAKTAMVNQRVQIERMEITDYFSFGLKADGQPVKDPGDLRREKVGDETYLMAGNVISGEDGYDKPGYLDYWIKDRGLAPRLVFLVDDGAVNILRMQDHYADGKHDGIQFIGFHVPQVENPRHADLIKAILDPSDPELAKKANAIYGLEPDELKNALEVRKRMGAGTREREHAPREHREESKTQ
jgi:hypothetical protein